jgi:hypothetical protein
MTLALLARTDHGVLGKVLTAPLIDEGKAPFVAQSGRAAEALSG